MNQIIQENKGANIVDGICFVLMPFKPDLDELYEKVIRAAVTKTKILRCIRADEIYGPRPIIVDIWRSIRESSIIIADLTGRNPNVLYELGLAHAIQKPVILLSQNIDDIPFDLKHLRIVIYSNTDTGRKKLLEQLHNALKIVTSDVREKTGLQQYEVLEPHEEQSLLIDDDAAHLLQSLRSKDPSHILNSLSKINELFEFKRKPKNYDPRILNAILHNLQNPHIEIQLAAIKAISLTGSQIHATHLYSFLSSTNQALVKATLNALGELHDYSAVPLLIKMYDDPNNINYSISILLTLGKIGGGTAISFLSGIARNNLIPVDEREIAIASLGNSRLSDEAIEALLDLDVDKMVNSLRLELASAIMHSDKIYSRRKLKQLEAKLKILASDTQSDIRGRALAAWCSHSFYQSSQGLDRSFLWDRLMQENDEALDEFFSLSGFIEAPFVQEESNKILELCEKYPTLIHHGVFVLKDIGNISIADFMIKAYDQSDDYRLWVLTYLSKVPCQNALGILRKELQQGDDPSRIVLAAVGLSRLQVEGMMDLISKNVNECHPWVKDIVRDYFVERSRKEKGSTRKSLLKMFWEKLINML